MDPDQTAPEQSDQSLHCLLKRLLKHFSRWQNRGLLFRFLFQWKKIKTSENDKEMSQSQTDQPLLHFPCVRMNRLNKTESAVFLYSSFSLFLKDPFSQIIYEHLKFRA